MKRFDGQKNPERRRLLESGEPLAEALDNGQVFVADAEEYVKITTTFAIPMEESFEVETLEGRQLGKAGDYLAVGQAGEMYPVDGAIFTVTYNKVEE